MECEHTVEVRLDGRPVRHTVAVDGGEEIESIGAGSVVRRRWPLRADLTLATTPLDGATRLDVTVVNTAEQPGTGDGSTRHSLLGAHLVIEARGASFVSLLEPPQHAAAAAATCHQDRCWPVLGGLPGDTDLLLGLPIILYDYPEVAQESPGALFDATEIDEILSLRVLTMTDAEKAEARATDPLAREIVDRVDAMSPETMTGLHGTLRYPGPPDEVPTFTDLREVDPPRYGGDAPWWDPAQDAAVDPHSDAVVVDGVRVTRGSVVRVHPQRRADAHDMFFADRLARVTAVLADVDGGTHVALVLVDDPAADLHDAAGRYFYFAPDEIEPVTDPSVGPAREDQTT